MANRYYLLRSQSIWRHWCHKWPKVSQSLRWAKIMICFIQFIITLKLSSFGDSTISTILSDSIVIVAVWRLIRWHCNDIINVTVIRRLQVIITFAQWWVTKYRHNEVAGSLSGDRHLENLLWSHHDRCFWSQFTRYLESLKLQRYHLRLVT